MCVWYHAQGTILYYPSICPSMHTTCMDTSVNELWECKVFEMKHIAGTANVIVITIAMFYAAAFIPYSYWHEWYPMIQYILHAVVSFYMRHDRWSIIHLFLMKTTDLYQFVWWMFLSRILYCVRIGRSEGNSEWCVIYLWSRSDWSLRSTLARIHSGTYRSRT